MLKILPLNKIITTNDRQRQFFPAAEEQELIESIQTMGLLTPIFLRPRNDKYVLVAGERRLRAITKLKKAYNFGEDIIPPNHIPAVVKYFKDDLTAAEAELHENLVRVNLTWQEQAAAVAALHALKLEQNPKHTKGQTASLIEEGDSDRPYASTTTYRRVHASLLVAQHLDNPDVQKAASLTQAGKIVSRIEEEAIQKKLREMREAKRIEAETKEPSTAPGTFKPPSPKIVKEKFGTLIYGDMLEHIPRSIPNNSVQVVVTDPPYGIGVATFNDGGKGTAAHEYSEENFDELHRHLVSNLDKICTKTAHVYIFCDIIYFEKLKSYFNPEEGWSVRRKALVWDKKGSGKLMDGVPVGWRSTHELILYAKRGKRHCSKLADDVISIADVRNKNHPAQKPVELYQHLLTMSAVPGDIVLDAFAGCGTIFHAARTLLLEPIGIELSDKYIALCEEAQTTEDVKWEVDPLEGL